MNIPIPVQWLGIATLILASVQGVKKLPFLGPLGDKYLGKWWGLSLALIAAFLQGFVLYSGDQVITGEEAMQIVITTLGAMGLHGLKPQAKIPSP